MMTWLLMWLNVSVATLNATLQLLVIYRFEVCLLVWFASQLHDFKHRKLNLDRKEIINHKRVPLFITLGKLTVSVGILNFWERECTKS